MPDTWDNYVKNKKKKRNAANTLASFVNSSNTKVAILDDLVYEDEPVAPSGFIGSLSLSSGVGTAIATVVGDIGSAIGAATSSVGSALGVAKSSAGSAIRSTGSKVRSSLVAKAHRTSAFASTKASEMWGVVTYRR